MMNKIMHLLPPKLTFILVMLTGLSGQAYTLSLSIGPQMESVKEDGSTVSRSNFTGFYGEFEMYLAKDMYMALALTSQTSIDTFSLVSFGIEGVLRYYLKGKPDGENLMTDDVSLSGFNKYSYFIAAGIFHRNLELTSIDASVDRGGIKLQGGGQYNLDTKYFVSGIGQLLFGGMGTEEEYQSIDIYLGIGLRF